MKTNHPHVTRRFPRCLSLLLLLALLLSMLPAAYAADAPTADLEISTAADLRALAEAVDAGDSYSGKTIVLTADIDAGAENWNPIGSATSATAFVPFAGTFDGQGHTVTIQIESAESYQGLFAYNTGTIRNLTVRGSISAKGYTGGICGYNAGAISGCTNGADVTGSGGALGGIAGCNKAMISKIENCGNYGAVSSTAGTAAYAGGIVGQSLATTIVQGCFNAGAISSVGGYTGGVVGYAMCRTISCYNTGSVTSASTSSSVKTVGGAAGALMGSGTLEYCYNTGSVQALNTGSLAGMATAAKVTGCYYLDGTAQYGICSLSSTDGLRTDAEMKDAAFASALGDSYKAVDGGYPVLTWQETSVEPPEEPVPDCRINLAVGSTNSSFTVPFGNTLEITWHFLTEDGVPKGWQMYVNGKAPVKNGSSYAYDVAPLTANVPTMAALATTGHPADIAFTPTKEQCGAGDTVKLTSAITAITKEETEFALVFVDRNTCAEIGTYVGSDGTGYHASPRYGETTISATYNTEISTYVTKNLPGYRLYSGDGITLDRQTKTLLVGENGVEPKRVEMYVEVNHSTTSPLHIQNVQFVSGETVVLETAVPLKNAWTGSYAGAICTIELDMTGAAAELQKLGYEFDQTQATTVKCNNYIHDPSVTVIEVTKTVCGHASTELQNVKAATCTEDGYTGDEICTVCGETVKKGEVIKAPGHKFEDGKCTVCGAADPDYKPVYVNPFTDVSENAWYYDEVLWAVNHDPQITTGIKADKFAPDSACTRAQVVTFLWRAMGCPEPKATSCAFTDLNTSEYYYKAVLWAAENGITTGVTATTFAPNATVTRGQFVTFLWRATGEQKASGSCPFTDVSSSQYYYNAVLWAVEQDVTNGFPNGTFAPNGACTRAQVVTFLYRQFG